jgi:serine protease Do
MRATFTHLTGPRKGHCDRFESERITVGRAANNSLVFGDAERRVSSHHAEIKRTGSRFILHDLGSTNGTMINGRRVITSEIQSDELIEFGAGGPLVRFGIEDLAATDTARESAEQESAEQNSGKGRGQGLGQSTVELMVDRAVRSRSNNFWLIAAILGAMVVGAVASTMLAFRLRPGPADFAEVAEQNSPAVVYIRTEFALIDTSGNVLSTDARSGTGFVVSPMGLIVTNRHLIHDWEYNQPPEGVTGRTTKIEVIFPGSRSEDRVSAVVYRLSANTEMDLAVLKINPPDGMPVVKGLETSFDELSQGDYVAVIGYPLGLDLLRLTREERIETSLSVGVISRVSQEMIQLNLRAYQGNSGGPVLNRRGLVIGILTANVGSAQDLALCTPMAAAAQLIKE